MKTLITVAMLGSMPSAAWEPETELLPTPPPAADFTAPPACRLTRTATQLVLSIGDEELKRFAHRSGENIVESGDRFDRALLVALETVNALRRAGSCR